MRDLKGQTLVVASHNSGKLREFADLLAPFGIEAKSAKEFDLPEPEETGTTFEQNAYIKAFAAAQATGLPAMSDDSGLVVDALDGQPGVYTANWAEKPDGTRDFMMAMEKTEKLLQEKGATEPGQRTGRFVAADSHGKKTVCAEDGKRQVGSIAGWITTRSPKVRPREPALSVANCRPGEQAQHGKGQGDNTASQVLRRGIGTRAERVRRGERRKDRQRKQHDDQ